MGKNIMEPIPVPSVRRTVTVTYKVLTCECGRHCHEDCVYMEDPVHINAKTAWRGVVSCNLFGVKLPREPRDVDCLGDYYRCQGCLNAEKK